MRNNAIGLGVLAGGLALASGALAAARLDGYGIDQNAVSISGISSGGYMAQQYHVAHSRQIMGVGVIAAGPFDCADGRPGWLPLVTAAQVCSHTGLPGAPFLGPPDLAASVDATRDADRADHVDPVGSLARARVFLFSGTKDSLEPQSVMDVLNQYYLTFVPAGQVSYVRDIPAEHAMVTDSYGKACGHLGAPYINNCGYDTAGEMLKFIYGPLNPAGDPAAGRLLEFDQTEFLPPEATSMAPTGRMFVPSDCETAPGCRLHVALHGCLQNQQTIGDAFYAHAGYNRWAASNRIIVLYPQTVESNFAPYNPNGCWDWWSYTNSRFATRSGVQITAIRKMISRLAAARGEGGGR